MFIFQIGFKLEENISVHGVNSDILKVTCHEAICWGSSFKSLLLLVTPDPQTGKLRQDGLIFKVYIFLFLFPSLSLLSLTSSFPLCSLLYICLF